MICGTGISMKIYEELVDRPALFTIQGNGMMAGCMADAPVLEKSADGKEDNEHLMRFGGAVLFCLLCCRVYD